MRTGFRVGMAVVLAAIAAAIAPGPGCAAEVVWNVVADKGVQPEDAKPAVDSTLAEAGRYLASHPGDTLVLLFPAGTYSFNHPADNALTIQGFTDGALVLRGEGPAATTFVFNQFDQFGIYIRNSNRIAVEGMHLTRPGLYTTQGDVVSVQPGAVRFRLHEGFPDPVWLMNIEKAQTRERTLLAFRGDPLDPQYDPRGRKVVLKSIEDAGGGLYDAVLRDRRETPPWTPGCQVALKSKCGAQTVRITNADDCRIEDVRFTRASAVPIMAVGDNDRMVVRRVRIERADPIHGRAPFFSGPGGGIQINAGADGPTIQDCVVVSTADDGIGLFSNDQEHLMSGALVEGNTIRDNQARGILITQSANGICRGNTLIRNNSWSIAIRNNQNAAGNAAVTNWEISRNTFVQPWVDSVIGFTKEVDAGLHDQIRILDNTFIDAPKNNHIVSIDNANDVEISGNAIESFSDEDDYNDEGTGDALVYVAAGRHVHGGNNTFNANTTRALVQRERPDDAVDVQWTNSAPTSKPTQ
ncbi:MAG: right-handed parallel beta-helix repeat-containing protein [Candidatus Sumerlaeota bacterium]|nr:right-handed parallel beta-helix repeat-containing protein [Candidatus Sumerlaeota bacterium]